MWVVSCELHAESQSLFEMSLRPRDESVLSIVPISSFSCCLRLLDALDTPGHTILDHYSRREEENAFPPVKGKNYNNRAQYS